MDSPLPTCHPIIPMIIPSAHHFHPLPTIFTHCQRVTPLLPSAQHFQILTSLTRNPSRTPPSTACTRTYFHQPTLSQNPAKYTHYCSRPRTCCTSPLFTPLPTTHALLILNVSILYLQFQYLLNSFPNSYNSSFQNNHVNCRHHYFIVIPPLDKYFPLSQHLSLALFASHQPFITAYQYLTNS